MFHGFVLSTHLRFLRLLVCENSERLQCGFTRVSSSIKRDFRGLGDFKGLKGFREY